MRLFVPEEGKIWRSPHEAMGIAGADVRFGGKQGRIFKLNAGDVVILCAGTGHQRIAAGKAFLQ